MKVQKELDETKIVLHKTIESVLERGEKIDSLVEKSDGLSAQSKMFYSMFRLSPKVLSEDLANHGWCRASETAKFVLYNNVIPNFEMHSSAFITIFHWINATTALDHFHIRLSLGINA